MGLLRYYDNAYCFYSGTYLYVYNRLVHKGFLSATMGYMAKAYFAAAFTYIVGLVAKGLTAFTMGKQVRVNFFFDKAWH